MAPVEIEVVPRDVVDAPAVAQLKIVDKVFELPLVNDTYNEVTRLAAPMSPFVETVKENMEKVTPMLDSGFVTIKTKAELFPQLPEGTTANIQARLDTAKEKVAAAFDNLDSLACEGLDQLTAKVPALKDATPDLIEIAKDTTLSYADYAKEYVASYSLAQIALKLGDKGLQVATDALKLAGLEESKPFKPVLTGIKTIRRNARAVRRAGAKAAGIEPAKTIGEASLLGAVAEIVGLNFFLSVVGLQLVPANMQSNAKTTELDTTIEDETVDDKLSNDRIASYVSDEDPDFVPSDASADSAEEDSEGEEAIVEVVEEVEENNEDAVEEVVKEIEGDIEISEDNKDVVDTIEDVEVVEEVKEKIEDEVELVVKEIEDDVEELVKEIEDDVEEVVEVVEEIKSLVEKVADTVEDVVEEVADTIEHVVEKVADKIEDLIVDVKDDVEEAGEADEVDEADEELD